MGESHAECVRVGMSDLITSAFENFTLATRVGFRNRRYGSFYWENRQVRCSGGKLEQLPKIGTAESVIIDRKFLDVRRSISVCNYKFFY